MVDRDENTLPLVEPDITGEEARERANELGRLVSLSDGVFAFAMTLLVVSVEIPALSGHEARTLLAHDVGQLWPQMLSFVIGFLVIGFLWSSHRRIFSRVRDFDDALIRFNILLLMLVAFLPFPTSILGRYGNLAFPSVFYALVFCAISLVYFLILDHLDRNRSLMTRKGIDFDFPRLKARHLVSTGVFLLSIPVAFAVPGFGQLTWLLLAFNHRISEWLVVRFPRLIRERQ